MSNLIIYFIKLFKGKSIEVLVSIIRNKLFSVYLGVQGFAILSQFISIKQTFSNINQLNLSECCVKQIVESKKSDNKNEIFSYILVKYLKLTLFISFILYPIYIIFQKQLTIFIFGSVEYSYAFYLVLLSYPVILVSTLPFSILKANKEIDYIKKIKIKSSFLFLISITTFFVYKNLTSSFVIIIFINLIVLNLNLYYAYKCLKKNKIKISYINKIENQFKFNAEYYKFLKFGIFTGILISTNDIICRNIVINKLGINDYGIYVPILNLMTLVTSFIYPIFSTYLYTKFCEAKTPENICKNLNEGFRLSLLFMLPTSLCIIATDKYLINLFFSDEFLPALFYLKYHFSFLIIHILIYVFIQSMASTGRIKSQSYMMIAYTILNIIVTYYGVINFGISGFLLKYIIPPLLMLIIYYVYYYKSINFKAQNIYPLLIHYIFCNSILIYINNLKVNFGLMLITAIFFILMTLLFISKNEINILKNRIIND